MSRIGKQPIILPPGVTMSLDGSSVHVRGPKGELQRTFHAHIQVHKENGRVTVTVKNPDDRQDRALWGLSRMLLQNMVTGVAIGFLKALEIHGVGYRVQVQGKQIILALGFSHPVAFALPDGVDAKAEGNILTLTGIDKQLVGETAARIRAYRKPEPYKGKGIRYVGEAVRRKAGKVMKGSE